MADNEAKDAVGFFSENAQHFHDLYRGQPEFHERLELWGRLIDRYAPRGGFALDLGCGPGIFSFMLAQHCERVIGVDGSAEMVAKCELQRSERGVANVSFRQGLLPDVDEAALQGADMLISSSVIEYVPDLSATLALFARLLKPGGLLILSMPNVLSLSRLQQRVKYRLTGEPAVYAHIKHFSSPRGLSRRLRPHGFELLEKHYYTHFTRIAKTLHAVHAPRRLSEDLFVVVLRKNSR